MPVTVPSPKNIALGEGVFYFNYDNATTPPQGSNVLVGAVRGGSFNREPEYREIDFMGKRGAVKGMTRKIRAQAMMTFQALEIVNSDNLLKFYAGLQKTAGATEEVITAKKQIDDADYIKNVAFVGETAKGKPIVVILKNALGNGAMELAFENEEEIVPEVSYLGHADPSDIAAEPWEIRYPLAANL